MARPSSRTPGDQPQLTPAPDTGQPFRATPPAKASKDERRTGRQLGVRVPQDVYEQLKDASERTDVPMSKLVVRALRAELDRLNG